MKQHLDFHTGLDDMINGSAGSDTLTGTAGNDTFDLTLGGKDQANGGDGNDSFEMGADLSAADRINGGNGNDVVYLDGTYSNLVLKDATLQNVEFLQMTAGHNYTITTADGNIAAGQTLQVIPNLNATDLFSFNAGAETDGRVVVATGAENDTVTGGAGDDSLVSTTGTDIMNGGAGNDLIVFNGNGALDANDRIDGGAGASDQLAIGGDYSGGVKFRAGTIGNIEDFTLSAGNYNFTMNDGNVAAGSTMVVDAYGSTHLVITAATETDGHYYFAAGKTGGDMITGGALSDTFDFRGETMSGANRNTINSLDFSNDIIKFAAVTAIDADVKGSLTEATFDTDLTGLIGAGHKHMLGAHHAVLVHANGGGLQGDLFLVIDGDGTAGYASGHDLVVQLNGLKNAADIAVTHFIG